MARKIFYVTFLITIVALFVYSHMPSDDSAEKESYGQNNEK